MVMVESTVTAPPFSVKLGVPSTAMVGASLAATTVTVEVASVATLVSSPELATPPLSLIEVRVKTRSEVLGVSLLLE